MTPEEIEYIKKLCEAAPSLFTLQYPCEGILTEDGYCVYLHSRETNYYAYLHPRTFMDMVEEWRNSPDGGSNTGFEAKTEE